MGEIIDITPRIEASRLSNLSILHNGKVDSAKALRVINERLRRLDEKIIKAEHVALYGMGDEDD